MSAVSLAKLEDDFRTGTLQGKLRWGATHSAAESTRLQPKEGILPVSRYGFAFFEQPAQGRVYHNCFQKRQARESGNAGEGNIPG